jgi:serine/threonine-protein kinase
MAGPDRGSWKERLARGEPSAVRFWYRESPRPLVPHRTTEFFAAPHDPPDDAPGAVFVELDTRGRLRRLEAVPPDFDDSTGAAPPPDWGPLLAAAGFDRDAFAAAEPRWFPPHYADRRAAFEGVYPAAPDVPIRLEAAAFRGRVVAFRTIEPWTPRAEVGGVSHWVRPEEIVPSRWARLAHMGFHVTFMIGLALLARRNLRLGRGDTRLAFRLASFVLAMVLAQWALGAHHVPDPSEMEVFFGGLYRGFFAFAMAWLFYVALEPYVRKLWPRSLISWIRLLNGRVRDPAVGRDVLLGCVFAVGVGLVFPVAKWAPVGPGGAPPRPDQPVHPGELLALRGPSEALAELFAIQVNSLNHILLVIGGLLLLRFVFRRTWLAVLIHGTLYVFVWASAFPRGYLTLSVWICVWYVLFFRFGWTSIVVGTTLSQFLTGYPLTADLAAWYAHATILAVGFCLALTLYGFKVSLGGRPAFRDLPAIE